MARTGTKRGAPRLARAGHAALGRELQGRLGGAVHLEIHDNTHTMVSFQELPADGWRVRLHHMFLRAPPDTVRALADFIRAADPHASSVLDAYIQGRRALIRQLPVDRLRARHALRPRGHAHDLSRVLAALDERYFGGRVRVPITWGPAPRVVLPRRSIKMGSYSVDAQLIRIHPALDQQAVPRYFVEWIVFHEMLHHVHPVGRLPDGRRCVHPPEFRDAERRFEHHDRAARWEREHLDLLLSWDAASAATDE
ncbi:MAG: hypothetical protein RL653_2178 [Pseudomonadota bacterium]